MRVAREWNLQLPLAANPSFWDFYPLSNSMKAPWLVGLETGFIWAGSKSWPQKEPTVSIEQMIEVFSYQGKPEASLEMILTKLSMATNQGASFVFSFSKVQLGPYSGLLYQATVVDGKGAAQDIGFCFFQENLWINVNFLFEAKKENLLSKEEMQQFLIQFLENTHLLKR